MSWPVATLSLDVADVCLKGPTLTVFISCLFFLDRALEIVYHTIQMVLVLTRQWGLEEMPTTALALCVQLSSQPKPRLRGTVLHRGEELPSVTFSLCYDLLCTDEISS